MAGLMGHSAMLRLQNTTTATKQTLHDSTFRGTLQMTEIAEMWDHILGPISVFSLLGDSKNGPK